MVARTDQQQLVGLVLPDVCRVVSDVYRMGTGSVRSVSYEETEGRRGGSQGRHIWPGEGRGGAGLVMAETGNRREDMRFSGEAYLERRGAGHKTVRVRCC